MTGEVQVQIITLIMTVPLKGHDAIPARQHAHALKLAHLNVIQ